MGGIISRPFNYIGAKATRVRQGVVDIKNGVTQRVRNVIDTTTSTYTNTKNFIVSTVTDSVNAVVNSVLAVRDGIANGYNRSVEAVVNTRNAVVNTVTTVKNTTVGAVVSTKNGVVSRVTGVRDGVRNNYRRLRATKFSKKQKAGYGALTLSSFLILSTISWIMVDVYRGDYHNAQIKLDKVHHLAGLSYDCGKVVGSSMAAVAGAVGHQGWRLTMATSEYAWEGSKVAGEYGWEASKVVSSHVWYGTRWTGYYVLVGAKAAALTAGQSLRWLALEGSVKFFSLSKYVLFNFGAASREASAYMWETSKVVGSAMLSGSVDGGAILLDGGYRLCVFLYHSTIVASKWTFWSLYATVGFVVDTARSFSEWSIVAGKATYVNCRDFCVWFYRFSITAGSTGYTWIKEGLIFTWETLSSVVMNIFYGISYVVNNFGVKWLYIIGERIANWLWLVLKILGKFLLDLAIYLATFLYLVAVQIYNLLYVICSFVLKVALTILKVFKLIVEGLVYIVTFLFRSIIWVLEEVISGYLFALRKYNMYRDALFFIILGLAGLYCTGLLRDFKLASEEKQAAGDPDSSDNDDDLLPSISAQRRKKIKTETAADSEDFGQPPSYFGGLDVSDSEDEFQLDSDAEVPDPMDPNLDNEDVDELLDSLGMEEQNEVNRSREELSVDSDWQIIDSSLDLAAGGHSEDLSDPPT